MLLPLLPSLVVLAATPICGGPVDLDTALGLAASRSDEVAIKRAEVATAEADVAIAKALRVFPISTLNFFTGPSPEVTGNYANPGRNPATDFWSWDTLSSIRPFTRLEITVVQPIYTFGRIDAARDAANAGLRARQSLVADKTAQVQLRVQELYWGIALARRFLAISDDVTKAIDDASKRVKKAIDAGDEDVGPSDQYKIDIFRGLVAGRTADAQKGLDLAQRGLAATLGLEPEELQLKEAPLETTEGAVPDREQLLEAARRQRPDLHALDDAILASNANVQEKRGARLPQFYLGFGVTWAWAPNRSDPQNPWISDYFDTHGWPIPGVIAGLKQDLAFPMMNANVEKAEAERNVLVKQRDGLVRLIEVQVDTALSELKAARTRYQAAKSSFNAARALYRSAGLDFAGGLIETNPLIDAYKQYVENQISAAQATYDLIVARARLAQAMGEPPRKALTCD